VSGVNRERKRSFALYPPGLREAAKNTAEVHGLAHDGVVRPHEKGGGKDAKKATSERKGLPRYKKVEKIFSVGPPEEDGDIVVGEKKK